MIQIKVLAFGIAKEIVANHELDLTFDQPLTIRDLKEQFIKDFPEFQKLASLRLAVNGVYATDDVSLSNKDEVAIIPPVSGG